MAIKQGVNGEWQHHWTFILAAAGSAVGLGNIWKFPYIAGENGGGAFVLVYLVCIALIGVPIMIAEVMLGRRGRMSPINAMLRHSRESNVSSWWVGVGWSGVLVGVLILSFYSVVAGWAFHYFMLSASGTFQGIDPSTSGMLFEDLLTNVGAMVGWHSLFLVLTLVVVSAGVIRGLGLTVRYLMPLLFILLFGLLIYSAFVGDFAAASAFMFDANTEALTWKSILIALGHAFFTLSLGMGAIMAYGAYMPETTQSTVRDDTGNPITVTRKVSIGRTVLLIALIDTLVALVAGLVIFPIVFASSAIEPSEGPGLLFISLPVAFGGMPAGSVFGSVFFFLVVIAALSSAISLIEPTVAWLVETKNMSRVLITAVLGFFIWVLGLGSVFSFNIWSEMKIFGKTFFDNLDFLTANIMMPLGGLLIAIFVGWFMDKSAVTEEVGDITYGAYHWWYVVLKFLSPPLLIVVFVTALIEKF